MTVEPVTLAVALAGWILAAVALALWWGERRARIMAQTFAGYARPPRRRPKRGETPPTAPPESGGPPRTVAGGPMKPKQAAKRVQEMFEGIDPAVAEDIARRVIAGVET